MCCATPSHPVLKMLLEIGLDVLSPNPASVLTTGTFDGVHVGHQAVLAYLLERSEALGGMSTVVTFDPHPREVVRKEAIPLLTTFHERAELMQALGVERLVVLPFTTWMAGLSAEAFVRDVLVSRIGVREMVIGYDHAFGRDRKGNAELLQSLGATLGFKVDRVPAHRIDGLTVSSSKLRTMLSEGRVAEAAHVLGRPYSVTGTVVQGDQRGRLLGYPTANVHLNDHRKLLPGNGVYAVRVHVGRREYGGMANLGTRPTFSGTTFSCEVHLFDLSENLYGMTLRVEFVDFVREEQRFTTIDELKLQLSRDEGRCRGLLE